MSREIKYRSKSEYALAKSFFFRHLEKVKKVLKKGKDAAARKSNIYSTQDFE